MLSFTLLALVGNICKICPTNPVTLYQLSQNEKFKYKALERNNSEVFAHVDL
jgi:hypothetical protein